MRVVVAYGGGDEGLSWGSSRKKGCGAAVRRRSGDMSHDACNIIGRSGDEESFRIRPESPPEKFSGDGGLVVAEIRRLAGGRKSWERGEHYVLVFIWFDGGCLPLDKSDGHFEETGYHLELQVQQIGGARRRAYAIDDEYVLDRIQICNGKALKLKNEDKVVAGEDL
ncbi:hypothetical protein Tco_1106302 [Tanacetum coccineum]